MKTLRYALVSGLGGFVFGFGGAYGVMALLSFVFWDATPLLTMPLDIPVAFERGVAVIAAVFGAIVYIASDDGAL